MTWFRFIVGILVVDFALAAEEAPRNAIEMRFVRIEPGVFTRGFLDTDGGANAFNRAHRYSNRQETKTETPSHKVAITHGFDLGIYEVTVAQFKEFVQATGYRTDAEQQDGALGFFPSEENYVDRFHKHPSVTWRTPGIDQSDAHPVICVTWRDANAFCAWLTKIDGTRHRLPTEAEWEYACRSGTETWYSWGNDSDQAYTHANVADGALEAAVPNTTRFQRAIRLEPDEGDNFAFTAPSGSFTPNAWGLFDMHGNVWEWCQDRWSADLYASHFKGVPYQERRKVLITDPTFTDETDQHRYGDWRVLRGGAWTCAPAAVRASIRTFAEAKDASVYTGFRVVREFGTE